MSIIDTVLIIPIEKLFFTFSPYLYNFIIWLEKNYLVTFFSLLSTQHLPVLIFKTAFNIKRSFAPFLALYINALNQIDMTRYVHKLITRGSPNALVQTSPTSSAFTECTGTRPCWRYGGTLQSPQTGSSYSSYIAPLTTTNIALGSANPPYQRRAS